MKNYIIINNRFCNLNQKINDILKSFIITSDLNDDLLEKYIYKIENRKYFDLVELDAKNGTTKKDIIEAINKFSFSSFEITKYKFFIIKDIDFLSESASNCLLKYLEDQDSKYMVNIFTTNNINNIIETVKSRCEIVYFNERNNIDFNIPIKDCLLLLSNDTNSVIEYEKIVDVINFIYNVDYKNIFSILSLFKNLSNYEISLLLDYLILKDGCYHNKIKFSDLKNLIQFNFSKTLIFNMILDVINFLGK